MLIFKSGIFFETKENSDFQKENLDHNNNYVSGRQIRTYKRHLFP